MQTAVAWDNPCLPLKEVCPLKVIVILYQLHHWGSEDTPQAGGPLEAYCDLIEAEASRAVEPDQMLCLPREYAWENQRGREDRFEGGSSHVGARAVSPTAVTLTMRRMKCSSSTSANFGCPSSRSRLLSRNVHTDMYLNVWRSCCNGLHTEGGLVQRSRASLLKEKAQLIPL